MALRIYQVATGNVGTEMVRRLQTRPDLELVGVHAYSSDKVGRDAGEVVGLGPIGVPVTGSLDELIAARPDCVTFHGVFPDVELYETVLSAGINVVTTADWITGHHRDANHATAKGTDSSRIAAACAAGGSTFYGTGMNPGLNQILAVVCTADAADVRHVLAKESVDVSCHHSVETWQEVGFGLPVDDSRLPGMVEKYTRVFEDAVRLIADCLDLTLDEVAFEYELGACTKDVDLGWYQLPEGSLGGCLLKYVGKAGGVAKVETHLEWQMTPHTSPRWDIQGCYLTQVDGDPCIYNKHMIFPRPGTDLSDVASFASLGMTVTGLPALNAIAAVVAAPPGIVTSADLPLRAFGSRFLD